MPRHQAAFNFQLHGVEGLDRALKELPQSVAKSTLRAAAKKALKPVEEDAEANAPLGPTGNLKESVTVKTVLNKTQKSKRAKAGDVEMFVGATWPKGAHAHLIEFGTAKMSPRPFLRPAWDKNKRKVLDVLGLEIWKALARTAKRLARQAKMGKLSKSSRKHFGLR